MGHPLWWVIWSCSFHPPWVAKGDGPLIQSRNFSAASEAVPFRSPRRLVFIPFNLSILPLEKALPCAFEAFTAVLAY
jgi:hypothetical protein